MQFVKESVIRAVPERVFAFHERADALQLLTPPWEKSRVVKSADISRIGSQAIIEAKIFGPFTATWIAEHTEYNPPFSFEDVQRKGPFRSWKHRHIIQAHSEGAILRDEITYELPLGVIGRVLADGMVQRRLQRVFAYRHKVTKEQCEK